jgi:hypothetical protein
MCVNELRRRPLMLVVPSASASSVLSCPPRKMAMLLPRPSPGPERQLVFAWGGNLSARCPRCCPAGGRIPGRRRRRPAADEWFARSTALPPNDLHWHVGALTRHRRAPVRSWCTLLTERAFATPATGRVCHSPIRTRGRDQRRHHNKRPCSRANVARGCRAKSRRYDVRSWWRRQRRGG